MRGISSVLPRVCTLVLFIFFVELLQLYIAAVDDDGVPIFITAS